MKAAARANQRCRVGKLNGNPKPTPYRDRSLACDIARSSFRVSMILFFCPSLFQSRFLRCFFFVFTFPNNLLVMEDTANYFCYYPFPSAVHVVLYSETFPRLLWNQRNLKLERAGRRGGIKRPPGVLIARSVAAIGRGHIKPFKCIRARRNVGSNTNYEPSAD